MRTAIPIAALCGLALAAGSAAAQPKPPPTDVSPVTVYPMSRPKVVATSPAAGQAVAGGVTILTVTFDQKMLSSGFDLSAAPGGQAPSCLKVPRLLDDGKTFAFLCTTAPGASYALAFNAGAGGGFANLGEQRAEPSALAFTTTTTSEGPRTIEAAMTAAKLKAFDVPIQVDPGPRATAAVP